MSDQVLDVEDSIPLGPFTAGVFCGVMMAQVDALLEAGHPYSEIAGQRGRRLISRSVLVAWTARGR